MADFPITAIGTDATTFEDCWKRALPALVELLTPGILDIISNGRVEHGEQMGEGDQATIRLQSEGPPLAVVQDQDDGRVETLAGM